MLPFNTSYFMGLFPKLVDTLPFTIEIIVSSIILAFVVGTLLAVVRIAKVPVLSHIGEIWLSYVRSMPYILDLYLAYFLLPMFARALGFNPNGWSLTVYVLFSLTFHYAPVISEIIRPAYLAIDKGQHEAAIVFGLSPFHRVFRIVAPQAFPIALPTLVSEAVNILKDTSIAYMIGVIDLMGKAGIIINANYGQGKLETYCAVAVIYWVIVIFIELAFKLFQKTHPARNKEALS